ncbi:transposon protein, putative, mutator sub-class [Hordeum vulgare]|nr:transposon protein, putative, mutator sub-class [Hordeum vulgare]
MVRAITDDEQAGRMLMFVDIGHHFFSLYLDHDDSFRANLSEDDVLNHPRASLPQVFSPTRRVHTNAENAEAENGEAEAEAEHGEAEAEAGHGEEHAEVEFGRGVEAPIPIQVVYPDYDATDDVNQFEFVKRASIQTDVGNDEQADGVQEGDADGNIRMRRSDRQNQLNYALEEEDVSSDTKDEDYEPDLLVDSDNEIGHGDDDLYADNVDEDEPEKKHEKRSNEKAKQKRERASDDEELNLKFKSFREEDLRRPKFHVGQVFESVELLRTAIREYSCQNKVDIKLPVNDRKRLKAKCDEDCTWKGSGPEEAPAPGDGHQRRSLPQT